MHWPTFLDSLKGIFCFECLRIFFIFNDPRELERVDPIFRPYLPYNLPHSPLFVKIFLLIRRIKHTFASDKPTRIGI